MLEAAEQKRKRLHARVNDTLWQAGWMLMGLGLTPWLVTILVWTMGATPAMDIQIVVGHYRYHMAMAPWAFTLLAGSIDPTEAKRIIGLCQLTVFFLSMFFVLNSFANIQWLRKEFAFGLASMSANVVVNGIAGSTVAHALWRHKCLGGEQMPPRRMLRRYILTFRIYLLSAGAYFVVMSLLFHCKKWIRLSSFKSKIIMEDHIQFQSMRLTRSN